MMNKISIGNLPGQLSRAQMRNILGGLEEEGGCQTKGKCTKAEQCCTGYSCVGCPDVGGECSKDPKESESLC